MEKEYCLMDVLDNLTKYRNALGFVADRCSDPQVSATVWMIEEAMGTTEDMIKYLMETGKIDTEMGTPSSLGRAGSA